MPFIEISYKAYWPYAIIYTEVRFVKLRRNYKDALQLRKEGLSYGEIHRRLGIPKSTLCEWFKRQKWSQKVKQQLIEKAKSGSLKQIPILAKINKKRFERVRENARIEAAGEFKRLKSNPLFISGLMLYWGEGDSKAENGQVRLINTDVDMMKFFRHFLMKICKVPSTRLKVSLYLYPDLSEAKCKIFWSNSLSTPTDQFYKTQFIKGRHPSKRLQHGICGISVQSRCLKEKILKWLQLYKVELIKKEAGIV